MIFLVTQYPLMRFFFIIKGKMFRRTLYRAFSTNKDPLLQKLLINIPKQVEVDVAPGFLTFVFQRTKKSPSYLLLKELFLYLKQSPILMQQFPFIKSDERFEQNYMALHLQILKSRFAAEKNISDAVNQLQLQKFNYNAQAYFFPDYAQSLHPHTPALNYASHYSQAYLKKFQIFEQYFNSEYEERPTTQKLLTLLRKLVYQNKVNHQDAELAKLSRYYIAHRRYLGMLTWKDLLGSKVKWGFEQQRKLLQSLGK